MKQISKYSHTFHHLNNHINKPFYLSTLSFSKNNKSILNYSHYKHINSLRSSPLSFNHQSSPFSTTPKDDTKTDPVDDTASSDTTTTTSTEGTPSTIGPTTTTPTIPTTIEQMPLIRIHDEDKPQLSIQLPNRWPFKRLARKPETPADPLNMHEMTTFSGLPSQSFMPSDVEKARIEAQRLEQKSKTKEEKQREARIKFWKRYTMVLLLTPLLLYILDNRKAKKLATRRGEYIASATSGDARSIRNMAQLNNAQLIDLYHWILAEECDNDPDAAMTLDQFGEVFVNAVNIFKQRKEVNGGGDTEKDIRLSRDYDDPLTEKDKKRELKWLTKKYEAVKDKRLASKVKELQPWDLNIFFTEYKLPSSNIIPLKTLFIAISQITTDTLYNAAEIAFRIHSQQIQEQEAEMTYNQLCELIDDMIITGHFTTDSLLIRRSYFPSTFGICTSQEIADMIYNAAELNKEEEGMGSIKFVQFGEALMKLAEGRRLYESCIGFFLPSTYKPWLMVWYCSDRSKSEISDAERKEKRELKKLEEKQKKMMDKLEKQKEENINVDTEDDGEEDKGDIKVQTN